MGEALILIFERLVVVKFNFGDLMARNPYAGIPPLIPDKGPHDT